MNSVFIYYHKYIISQCIAYCPIHVRFSYRVIKWILCIDHCKYYNVCMVAHLELKIKYFIDISYCVIDSMIYLK